MPNNKKKGQQSGAEVMPDDFDDMLPEFAASDLENIATTNITATASATITSASTPSTSSTSSTTSSASNPTEEEIINALCCWQLESFAPMGEAWHPNVSAGSLLGAVFLNNLDMMRCLAKDLFADVNQMNDDGVMPTIMAAKHGHMDAMRCLVKELGANVDLAGRAEWTPLLLATNRGHLEFVRCLVKDLGADVNQTGPEGITALLVAASLGNLSLVRALVKELGADVNLAMPDGHTLLMVASTSKHPKVVKLLLKGGADAQASSRWSEVLLDGTRFTAALGAAAVGAPAELTEYLEAKTHCSNSGCSGAGIRKCTGCKQARHCGQVCQLAHWPAHKADCKVRQA
jgi:hypothetical protein